MPKVAFLGAGSVVFAKNLIGDLLSFPELRDGTHLALHDIDPERLATTESVARKLSEAMGAKPCITSHLDRREALEGADYAINMIQVGGYQPSTVVDFEIPKRYGLKQTIADTLGIGGIMRAVRTIPVMLDFAADMEEVCPDVLFLNYTNPMAMLCMAMDQATDITTVGLCHSVFGTADQLARRVGLTLEDVNYVCAGINHMAFFLTFEHNGQDLYPAIKETAKDPTKWENDQTRRDCLNLFGYAITESSEHFSEYVPWYIKRDRPDVVEEKQIPIDEYIRRCIKQNETWESTRSKLLNGEELETHKPTREYGTYIIHSMETGQPRTVYSNVPNAGIITNIPDAASVEVPCLVDRNGVQPIQIGEIPTQLAALMRTNVNVQELTVEGVLSGNRERIYQAALLDPHTAAELTPDQIVGLVDDLIEAHGDFVPESLRR